MSVARSEESKTWTAVWNDLAEKTLAKLAKKNPQQAQILRDALKLIAKKGDPYAKGKALTGQWAGYW